MWYKSPELKLHVESFNINRKFFDRVQGLMSQDDGWAGFSTRIHQSRDSLKFCLFDRVFVVYYESSEVEGGVVRNTYHVAEIQTEFDFSKGEYVEVNSDSADNCLSFKVLRGDTADGLIVEFAGDTSVLEDVPSALNRLPLLLLEPRASK